MTDSDPHPSSASHSRLPFRTRGLRAGVPQPGLVQAVAVQAVALSAVALSAALSRQPLMQSPGTRHPGGQTPGGHTPGGSFVHASMRPSSSQRTRPRHHVSRETSLPYAPATQPSVSRETCPPSILRRAMAAGASGQRHREPNAHPNESGGHAHQHQRRASQPARRCGRGSSARGSNQPQRCRLLDADAHPGRATRSRRRSPTSAWSTGKAATSCTT